MSREALVWMHDGGKTRSVCVAQILRLGHPADTQPLELRQLGCEHLCAFIGVIFVCPLTAAHFYPS